MKPILYFLLGILLLLASIKPAFSQNDTLNGDWAEQRVILLNTAEADMMVRAGDIDNLGFGWPNGFDPFSGATTPSHGFPWAIDTSDVSGTDRIMVVTSYVGSPPHGKDGYTNTTSRPENLPRPITLHYDLNGLEVTSATLQMFVDDFQAPNWHANYFVTINGEDAPYIAEIINSLSQTGPVGKLITVNIADYHLPLIYSDSLSIMFDDTTTGAGDGYAVDFVKLLLNPKSLAFTGSIEGYVTSASTGLPVPGAYVKSSANATRTDNDGYYFLDEVPAGLVYLSAYKYGYESSSTFVDLESEQTIVKDFVIEEASIEGCDTLNFPLVGEQSLYVAESPEFGYVTGNNSFGDKAKADFFEMEGNGYLLKVLFEFAIATNESGNNTDIYFAIWDANGPGGAPGDIIAEQYLPLSVIVQDVENEDLTVVDFPSTIEVEGSFYAGIMLPEFQGDTVALWSNEDGDAPSGIAWEMWSDNTWYAISDEQSWFLQISQTIFPVVCEETNVEENNVDEFSVSVYPNPAFDKLYLLFREPTTGLVSVSLYNSIGEKLYNTDLLPEKGKTLEMDLQSYPNGIYFLSVQGSGLNLMKKIIH